MSEALIQLSEFSYRTNNQTLLREIELTISPEDKIALVGPSGAGKSTLLHCLYERIHVHAALCPQQLGLVDSLSAYHNIYMGQLDHHNALYNLWNLIHPWRHHKTAIAALCREFSLPDRIWQPVSELSGGEQQRVALARACYASKPVFIGDEPLSSLDPELRERLLAQLLARHPTVIMSLHAPELATQYFQRVIGLRAGCIVFDKAATDISPAELDDLYSAEIS
ncbi:ATP-binding cassette domain-containing protein [Teredinibacter turnerae]|uniref:ATP-binding cassette domain-containing protein n=1 Tax=Teredinibacter turnerae TaxID=2426 RepID=UPI0005F7FDF3|nr:ATP-binding cassette domain-containing protein [Teredinibacter turnerae]